MSNATDNAPESSTEHGASPDQSRQVIREERRRRQNRLYQQAWRQRQRARKELERPHENQELLQQQATANLALDALRLTPLPDLSTLLQTTRLEHQDGMQRETDCALAEPHIYRLLSLFESAAYKSYIGNPCADHLLTLVKLNVFRAFVHNISILGYNRGWMTDDALSRFNIMGPHLNELQGVSIPASLQPTAVQQSQPHHPWLDFFPFAQLRDRLIEHEDLIDDSGFCRDLMGFWNLPKDNFMLVWGDPWNPIIGKSQRHFYRSGDGL